jgi:hypothetical protein
LPIIIKWSEKMGIFELYDLAKKRKKAQYKAVFSTSTYDSPTSISGQLGYYDTLEEAVTDIADRLPNIGGIFGRWLGTAKLFKKVNGKWKYHGKYGLTENGKLYKM